MSNWSPFVPYLVLALICGLVSLGIAFMVTLTLANGGHASDNGMFAFAAMVAAPSVMGIGIAAFMPPK
jgi:hypothetical protein